MPLQATSGAASYDAFGGGVPVAANYIEDVFSTWLYTGNGATQTINNGIDLAGKGGLVWFKQRDGATVRQHVLVDTVRGAGKTLASNLTSAETTDQSVSAFSSTGFTVTDANPPKASNDSPINYASWAFREQPKFFDVVTYTGNGSARTIAHNLDSVPGCIIIKCLNDTFDWIVWHRSFAATNQNAFLNTTDAAGAYGVSSSTAPTSTVFSLTTSPYTNQSGKTYVAYLFAHDAGGFGLTGTDNVISCGSFTDPASGNTTEVNLGYEPQWLLVKPNLATTDWYLVDNMRGMVRGTSTRILNPNLSAAESNGFANGYYQPTATGFTAGNTVTGGGGTTCIYIAIRRGPMRTPTTGTSVFDPETATASTGTSRTIGFPADMSFGKARTITASNLINDRLRGYANSNTTAPALFTNLTSAEDVSGTSANVYNVWNTTALDGAYFNNLSTVWYHFRRASGFFDVVCDTGTGSVRTVAHNLGVAPEFIIRKMRGGVAGWYCYHSALGNTDAIRINSTSATASDVGYWNNTTPTSTQFTVGTSGDTNQNTATFVTYLFATCPGVSKVGSYTGTGSTQTINCGFTAGARFVLIKRTDSTGAWFVWDTARGMVSGTDPRLALNNTDAEINQNWVYTSASGFQIVTSNENVNTDGGTYIFLAIA